MEFTQSVDLALGIKLVAAMLGGLITGLIGGMVGLALGRPRLLLVYWTANSPANAAGTNILISGLASATGTWQHFREGRIDYQVLALMGIPTFIGAFVGGFFAGMVPVALLLVVVGVTTTWYGYGLFTGRRRARGQEGPRVAAAASDGATAAASDESPSLDVTAHTKTPVRRYATEMALGLGIGLFGGVVGLVLGQLRLPAMINVLGLDPRIAAGTNLAIATFTGLFGFAGHMLHWRIDFLLLLVMGSTAMLGSYLGAKQTGKVSPRTLRRWMGGVMIITAIPLFWLAYTQF
jgi:uncharacterized protein